MNWTLHVSSNQTSSARWHSSIWSKITLILFAHHPVIPHHYILCWRPTQRLPEEGKPGGRLPLQLHHNDDGAPHLARNLWQGCWSRSSCGWGCWSRSLMDKMPPLDMVVTDHWSGQQTRQPPPVLQRVWWKYGIPLSFLFIYLNYEIEQEHTKYNLPLQLSTINYNLYQKKNTYTKFQLQINCLTKWWARWEIVKVKSFTAWWAH